MRPPVRVCFPHCAQRRLWFFTMRWQTLEERLRRPLRCRYRTWLMMLICVGMCVCGTVHSCVWKKVVLFESEIVKKNVRKCLRSNAVNAKTQKSFKKKRVLEHSQYSLNNTTDTLFSLHAVRAVFTCESWTSLTVKPAWYFCSCCYNTRQMCGCTQNSTAKLQTTFLFNAQPLILLWE